MSEPAERILLDALERDPYTVELDEVLEEYRRFRRLLLPVVVDPRALWRNTVP